MEDPLQIIIVVIIMVVGAIRWFFENVVQKGKQNEDEADGNTLEDLYEEARREILEQQNRMYPEDEEPPETAFVPEQEFRPASQSPYQESATPPPVPPPLPTRAAQSEPSAPTFRKRTVEKPKLSAAEEAALARVREREQSLKKGRRKHHGTAPGIRGMLASPQAARQAVLLREILRPPKGAPEQSLPH